MYIIATVWTVQMVVPKFIPIANKEGTSTIQSVIESAREGIAYIANNRLILALMVLGLAPIFLGMPYTSLMPIFAIDILHGNAGTQGLLLTMVGVGAVIGALVVASLPNQARRGMLLTIGNLAFPLFLLFFAQSTYFYLSLILMLYSLKIGAFQRLKVPLSFLHPFGQVWPS
jgi:predicted MFS family arabinose efflux permease